jgi:multiple antibiotic resistance protein
MNEYLSFGLLCFTSFFTLINPLGTVPMFMSMTSGADSPTRNAIAGKAVLTALVAMVLFAFFGQVLFQLFGISVNGLRVVGGIIFFAAGYDMLQGKMARTKASRKDAEMSYDAEHDVSITPLGIPIICGPGAITNSIVLMEDASTMGHKAILLGTMALICLLLLLSLRAAAPIMRLLGETGNRVLTRLMGLIIMVIAVEFFFAGLAPVLRDIIASARP